MKKRPHDLCVGLFAFVFALLPATAVPAKARDGATIAPEQPTTTFNFQQMPVRSALVLIAEEGHFNLVLSDAVQGTVTLHLTHVTCQQALDVVLRLKGLSERVEGTTLWVDSASR